MSEPQREQWDAIVIGSGLGGLACAAYLCAAGKRTLVLEAHYVAGGNSQVFRRGKHGRKYEFDVGLHYIGECGKEGSITRILRTAGLADRVSFRQLDPAGYTTLIFPDFQFRVPAGWDRYRARLLETFPAEAEVLGQVVDILCEVAEGGRRFQNREIDMQAVAAEAPRFLQWGLRPVTELFHEYGISPQAAAVLLGEQGDYAVRPSRTPVALAAGLTDHYMRGAFYPQGGGQMIAARLIEAIRSYGGEVRTRSPVSRVRVDKGRVVGVALATGGEIDAPVVVSNADLKRTVTDLVGEQHFSAATVERVRAFRMTVPLFVVYLGIDVDLVAQGLPNTNYFVWGDYDLEAIYDELEAGRLPEKEFLYVTVASLKDPTSQRLAPPGYTNLQIMTLVPREYGLWNVGDDGAQEGAYHRDPEYRRRKEALAEHLIASAERIIPGLSDLRAHIDWQESATPVTQERFTHSTGGTSYGIEFACDQMGPLRIGPETEIGGLFLCGASTPSGHGIGGVLRGGVITASAVLGSDLMSRVIRGDVLGDPQRLPPLHDDWDPWRESH
ncbi:MAG: NAD(P)/FAD-dependent oxidoreductase [Deltaproteobacteria bacterium]|nr:NAD(P)/FAD-dependent oxidoreductase [Deltaproteobacteria bacterium]